MQISTGSKQTKKLNSNLMWRNIRASIGRPIFLKLHLDIIQLSQMYGIIYLSVEELTKLKAVDKSFYDFISSKIMSLSILRTLCNPEGFFLSFFKHM